jgi:hypothetical protein
MFYCRPSCDVCSQGQVGFWICTDSPSLILVCNECCSAWLDPKDTITEAQLLFENGRYTNSQNSFYTPQREATLEEISRAGLADAIVGEFNY